MYLSIYYVCITYIINSVLRNNIYEEYRLINTITHNNLQ